MANLCITVTVLAEAGETGRVVERGGGRVGDFVYVTGKLGGAWRTKRHFEFEPRIELALELVKRFEIRAMIDLSDGLGRDLDHVAEMSGVGVEVEAELVPCHDGCGWEEALSDGEDYELCFVVPSEVAIPDEVGGVKISKVGRLVEMAKNGGGRTVVVLDDGERRDASEMGWAHE